MDRMDKPLTKEEINRLPPIDREKTCPLLLKVFYKKGQHHSLSEYQRGKTPSTELQIYTWMDATLKELTGLVKEVNPESRKKGTFFDFSIVYPGTSSPTYLIREIGTTCSGRKGADDNVTLAARRFQIGDYLDIAISPPQPVGVAGGRFRGGRGNRGGMQMRGGPPRNRGRPF